MSFLQDGHPSIDIGLIDLRIITSTYRSPRDYCLSAIHEGMLRVNSPEMVAALYSYGVTEEDLRTA